MTRITFFSHQFFGALIMTTLLFATLETPVLAQGQGNQGDQVGVQQDQDRDQVQNQIRDPETHTNGDEPDPDRDRLRDQDQTNAPAETTQAQMRSQEQVQVQQMDGTGDGQQQNRDRVRTESTESLRAFIQEQEQERLQDGSGVGERSQSRARAQVATEVFQAAEPLMGQNGPRMSEVATEVNQAFRGMEQREQALENRSRVRLFFFGQDEGVVGAMQQEMEQNRLRIEEMRQLMESCDGCDPEAQEPLMTQLQNMEREQERLETVAADAEGRQGLFGFLFGWMR
jgi:hypothetical protein